MKRKSAISSSFRSVDFYVLLLCVLLRIASGPTADFSYIVIAFYSLRGRRQAIEALTLSFIFTNLNPHLFPSASYSDLLRYFVVATAFVSVFFRRSESNPIRFDSASFILCTFGLYIIVHSLLFSQYATISLLKSVTWLMTMLTAVFAWKLLSPLDFVVLKNRFWFLLGAVIVCSILVSSMSAAYLPRTNFLRGVLFHSQALGSLASVVAVWALISAFSAKRPSSILLILGLAAAYCVYLSGARTALVAFLGAMAFALVASFFRPTGSKAFRFPGLKDGRVVTVVLIAMAVSLVQYDRIYSAIVDAFLKYGSDFQGMSFMGAYTESRGDLISEMWSNIIKDPIMGIGFGLPSDLASLNITSVFGIPIGAPVEKGVTPIAVWEEIGVIGAILFLMWLFAVSLRTLRGGGVQAAVLITIMLINLGEASLMSAGGIGLFQIIVIGWLSSKAESKSNQKGAAAPNRIGRHIRPPQFRHGAPKHYR